MLAIHGTNTSEEPSVTANCNGLPVCSIHATENSYIIHITPPGLPLLVSKKNPCMVISMQLKIAGQFKLLFCS